MFLYVLILFLISLIWLFITHSKKFKKNFLNLIISLWAWTIISLSIVHILPESISTNENIIFFFIAWFLLIYIIENFLMIHTCVEHDCHYHHIWIISWIALFIHTLFDGIWIWAWFSVNLNLWILILTWVCIHQVPVSISISSLLASWYFSKKIQTLLMIIFALAAPVWLILSLVFLKNINNDFIINSLLALSWWSLLYIWASDLLPMIHKKNENRILIILFFLIWIIGTSLVKFLE